MGQKFGILRLQLKETEEAREALAVERDALVAEKTGLLAKRDVRSTVKSKQSLRSRLRVLMINMDSKKMKQFIRDNGPQILIENQQKSDLLDLSLKYRDYPLYSFFLEHRLNDQFDVDLPDFTSLIVALKNDDVKEAIRLYDVHSDATIRQLHPERTIELTKFDRIGIRQNNWAASIIIPQVVSKLRNEQGWSYERIGRILGQFGQLRCKFLLDALVDLVHPEMTEAYLKSNQLYLDGPGLLLTVFQVIVKNKDLRNLEVFFNYSSDEYYLYYLKMDLMHVLVKEGMLCDLHRTEAGRAFVRGLISFELFTDENALYSIEWPLKRGNRECLEIFFQYEFRSVIRSKLQGRDVLASIFQNANVDATWLLKSQKIDVDARGYAGQTPLRYAVDGLLVKNVKILLDRGADPNALDDYGYPALYEVLFSNWNFFNSSPMDSNNVEEIVKLLLIAGADPYLLLYLHGQEKDDFFKIKNYNVLVNKRSFVKIIKHFLAQLAIYEELGQSVEEQIKAGRKLNIEWFDCFYEKCRRNLKQLKAHEINYDDDHEFPQKKFSIFTLLSSKEERIARYVNGSDRRVIANFMNQYKKDKSRVDYYYDALKRRVEVIDRLNAIVDAIKCAVAECMRVDKNHLTVHKIVNYLAFKDFMMLAD